MIADSDLLSQLARRAAASIRRPFPYKTATILTSQEDLRLPQDVTPCFFGCFDWHSSVHSHWALVRLIPLVDTSTAQAATRALAHSLCPANTRAELANLHAPGHASFEMPYGMAWLLELDRALHASQIAEATQWRRNLEPVTALARTRLADWVTRLPCPVRGGEHSQSAFAMRLALDWAKACDDSAFEACLCERARAFYSADRSVPIAYEPSAYDFLSPALATADLMARVLHGPDFRRWFSMFLPQATSGQLPFAPVTARDPSDGKLVHFDGLNLSRAWMLWRLADAAPELALELRKCAQEHAGAGLSAVITPHYAGAHWLGSFAVYWHLVRTGTL